MANDISNFPGAGMPPGGPPAVGTALKAGEYNADKQGLSDFPGVKYIRGALCADKASNAVHTEIWLQAANALGATTGNREVCDAGCTVRIYYNGTHMWTTTAQVVGADVFISFADVDCDSHAVPGIADYSAGAFIAALHIHIDTYPSGPPLIAAPQLLASATAPNGVNSDTIPRGAAAPAGSIEEGLADAEADLYSVVAPGGGLLGDVVTDAQLDLDAHVYDSDENLFYGRMEEDDNRDGIVNNWYQFGAGATFTLDNTHVETGAYAQRVQAPGPGQGIYGIPSWPHLQTDFKGMSVTVKVRVWTTNANGIYVELWDGVAPPVTSPASGDAGGLAGFSTITLRQDRDAAATNFVVRIYSVAANDFWIDSVKVSLGVTSKAVSLNPWGVTYDIVKQGTADNWFPNGDFKDWTNLWGGAAGAPPDEWAITAGAPVIAQNAVTYLFGQYSMDVTTVIGDAIQIATVNPLDFVFPAGMGRQTCCISFYYRGVAGNPVLQVTVGDGVINPVYTIYPVVGVWQRFIAFIEVQAASITQYLNITEMNIPGGNFLIDGVKFNRGIVPYAFETSRVLQPQTWDFVNAGAAPAFPQNMTFHGSLLEAVVKSDTYVHRLMVNSVAAPGGIVIDTYDVLQNGVPVGITATVNGAATTGATHVPGGFLYNQGDLLQVLFTPGAGTAAANMSCAVEAYKIGS